jgi:hypothetical protein
MAFTKGVTARERERQPGEPWLIGDESAEWLQAHSHRPPWNDDPVILIVVFMNGHSREVDLEYRGINPQGVHQLYAIMPRGKIKLIRLRMITPEHRVQVHIPRRR